MDAFGYCSAEDMLMMHRQMMAPAYSAYVGWILARNRYGKSRKYRKQVRK